VVEGEWWSADYSGPLLPDHYPVKITRESIKPGTILYDPYGHLAVVYKVTAQGRVHFIEVNPLAGLHPVDADLAVLCGKIGMSYQDLIGGILTSALGRLSADTSARGARA